MQRVRTFLIVVTLVTALCCAGPVAATPVAGAADVSAGEQAARPFLADHLVISFYGTPLAPGLGVLGEQEPAQTVARLRAQADAYAALVPERTVVPALHLIYAIAQAEPGASGLYLGSTSDAIVEQYIELARANGMLLFLDIQMGRSTIEREVSGVAGFLTHPHVHLALDPEFAWGPDVTPVEEIGYLTADQINEAQALLQGIARENALPDKILIVHQFRHGMIRGKPQIEVYDGVELVIDMDGFGPPAAKLATYDAVVTQDGVQFPGVKLFYDYDRPLMSPEDVLALEPRPVVVIYQ